MNAVFTEEQRLFQRTVREFLEKACPPERVRAAVSAEGGWSWERWKGLADLGVLELTSETDVVLLLEEAGRVVLPEPLAETVGVVTPTLVRRGAEDEWVRRIAGGDALATIDEGEIVIEAADGSSSRVAVGDQGADRAAWATAAELCGIADRVIEMAASYAKERQQFGKQIGSFQAVKHLLADALLGLDFARPAVYRAAWSLATSASEVERDVSIAKARASEAAVNACRASLQVHGAIGYTHEHDLHLWLTKGFDLARRWGTAAWHRERVAQALV